MDISHVRAFALNILKELGILADGVSIPEMDLCSGCREEILATPPKSITILLCGHIFHRTCIEKDLSLTVTGVPKCPNFRCHKDVEVINHSSKPATTDPPGNKELTGSA